MSEQPFETKTLPGRYVAAPVPHADTTHLDREAAESAAAEESKTEPSEAKSDDKTTAKRPAAPPKTSDH